MTLFDTDPSPPAPAQRGVLPLSDLDLALTAQLGVAWAGESGEEPRLGWWRTDLVSEFGGMDLFRRLLPATWEWAVLQAAREAARRADADLRARDSAPDNLLSLFHFGVETDTRLDERLQDLKRAGRSPEEALHGLAELTQAPWSSEAFAEWVAGHGAVETTIAPVGRRLKGDPASTLGEQVRRLVAALAPLGDAYPLPHVRTAA